MPLFHNQFVLSVGTPVQVVPPSTMPQQATLHNLTKSSNEFIFIGSQAVSTANAMHIDPGETVQLTLAPGDDLWAVSAPGGLKVGVLAVTQN
jgi:hypothetical protein